jgi:hypothetical protein
MKEYKIQNPESSDFSYLFLLSILVLPFGSLISPLLLLPFLHNAFFSGKHMGHRFFNSLYGNND